MACIEKEPKKKNDHDINVFKLSLCVISGEGIFNYALWRDEEEEA